MATDRRLDERISRWLEAEAPGPLPDRVLRATFERTVEAWSAGAGLPDRLETSFVARAVGRRGTNGRQTIGGGQNG